MAMLEAKPANRQQMALLSGVGEQKLKLYARSIFSGYQRIYRGPQSAGYRG